MSGKRDSPAAATARALRERGELMEVVRRYGSIDSEGGDAWNDLALVLELARTYSLLGHETEVELYFLRCVELHPRRAALYRGQIGWHFQRKKRWARALQWYDGALQTFPGYHLCLFRKGYCLERLHRPSEAAIALSAADRAFTGSALEQQERSRGIQIQVLFHLARNLRETGRTGEAKDCLDRCEELDDRGNEPVIRQEHRLASYGEILLREGKASEAVGCLESARRLDPQSSVISERLARGYEAVGRFEDAESLLRAAVELPKGEVALVALGAFLRRTQQLQEASEVLMLALNRHPRGEVHTRIEVAELQLALSRPKAALLELERLAGGRVPPGSTLARIVATRIAEVLLTHGENSRALPHLRVAVEQEVVDSRTREHLEALLARAEADPVDSPRPLEDEELPAAIVEIFAGDQERCSGRVKSYFEDRGFGFIAYGEESATIFFHVSHFQLPSGEVPAPGQEVTFVVGVNQRTSRSQAEEIRPSQPPD